MDPNEMDSMADGLKDSAMNALKAGGRKAGKAGANVIKKGLKKAAAIAKKALIAVLKIAGPYLLVGFLILMVLALAWTWVSEERGTTGRYTLDPEQQNVTVTDENGIERVVALTEEQAYINAYYKYMACSSYSKMVGTSNKFTFRNETADFAGLQDYYKKEEFFYLSPDFLMMADETLHEGKFFYPEQLIKSVPYEIEDGKVSLKPIYDKEGKMIESKSYNQELTSQVERTEPGTWDYGFGSVLQYAAFTKEKYIACEYTSYPVDIDRWIKPVIDKDGYIIQPGFWVHSSNVMVQIPDGSTADSAIAQLRSTIAFYTSENTRCSGPDEGILRKLMDEKSHITMKLEGEDVEIGKRTFSDSALSTFSNSTDSYPIQIPLITAAASFSGTIHYNYIDQLESRHLDEGTSGTNGSEMDPSQPVDHLYLGQSSCGATKFIIERKGDVNTKAPLPSEEDDKPCGFGYLSDYCSHYKSFVPVDATEKLNFTSRIEEDSKTRNLLVDLGLLTKYTGIVAEGANYNLFKNSHLTAADYDFLLENTDMRNTGEYWVELEETHGVNALFAIAVAGQESGWGSSEIAKSKNNLFGIGPEGQGAFSYPSIHDCIIYFGFLMKNQKDNSGMLAYQNKSIDEISAIYCTSDPVGWATAIKSIMATVYTKLIANGASPDILSVNPSYGSTSIVSAEKAASAVALSGKNPETLYQNTNFDVLSSTSMLQKLRDPNSGILNSLGAVITDVASQISSFFSSMNDVFMGHFENVGQRAVYGARINRLDIEGMVYKAIAFSTGSLYSTVENAVNANNSANTSNADDLSFLFVGKESMIGLGTGAGKLVSVPGVKTTIDGFISPTKTHYQPISPWSDMSGGCELSVPKGTPILSVANSGTVTDATKNIDGSGYQVSITYLVDGKTYGVIYKNLYSISVSNGSKVSQGDQIGLSGTKADGTSCLFFGFLNSSGNNVNPLGYFYQPTLSNSALAEVALTQVGNVGGAPFWSWYGFNARVEWCACFVSWCAEQCGYIENHTMPKFAACSAGVEFFKFRNQWVQSTGRYEPVVGNVIFFDWEGDGRPNHVGIVKDYRNGIVFTIEGNSGDHPGYCRERTYNLYSKDILGYGVV